MSSKEREWDLPDEVNHVKLMFPSKYLAGPDLQGRDVTLTILKVTKREVAISGTSMKEVVNVLHFKEMQSRPEAERKAWIMNTTNANMIAEIHKEPNPLKWGGLRITIYFDESVMFGKRRTGGLRIRPVVPPEPQRKVPADAQ